MMTEKLSSVDGASSSSMGRHDEEQASGEELQATEETMRKMKGFVKVEIEGGFMWVKESTAGGLNGEGEGRELEYDADELKGDLEI